MSAIHRLESRDNLVINLKLSTCTSYVSVWDVPYAYLYSYGTPIRVQAILCPIHAHIEPRSLTFPQREKTVVKPLFQPQWFDRWHLADSCDLLHYDASSDSAGVQSCVYDEEIKMKIPSQLQLYSYVASTKIIKWLKFK